MQFSLHVLTLELILRLRNVSEVCLDRMLARDNLQLLHKLQNSLNLERIYKVEELFHEQNNDLLTILHRQEANRTIRRIVSFLESESLPSHAGGMAIPYRSLNPLCRNASSHTAPMQLEKLSAPHLSNSPQVSTVLPGFLPKATVKFSWSYGKNRVGGSMLNTEQCALSLHLWYSCPLSPA